MDDKKSRNWHYILSEIYGFPDKEIRSGNNGSWDIEQYEDDDMTYHARILKDGKIYIAVYTKDIFPKLVTEYEYQTDVLKNYPGNRSINKKGIR